MELQYMIFSLRYTISNYRSYELKKKKNSYALGSARWGEGGWPQLGLTDALWSVMDLQKC